MKPVPVEVQIPETEVAFVVLQIAELFEHAVVAYSKLTLYNDIQ